MRTDIEEYHWGFSFILQTIRHGYIKSLTFKFYISALLRLQCRDVIIYITEIHSALFLYCKEKNPRNHIEFSGFIPDLPLIC